MSNIGIVNPSKLSIRTVVRAFEMLPLYKSAFQMEATADRPDGTINPHTTIIYYMGTFACAVPGRICVYVLVSLLQATVL